jgi:hypothetical protein
VAPLVGITVGYFISTDPFPRSPGLTGGERAVGVGIAAYLGGFGAGVVTFAITFMWARFYIPDDLLKVAQAVSAMAIAGLVIWGAVAYLGIAQHAPPEYAGQRATLDIEIRAPKSLLDGAPVTVLSAFLENGSVRATRYLDCARDEGDWLVLPYELDVFSLHDWTAKVYRTNKHNSEMPYYFRLALPRSPKGAVPWSDWVAPEPRDAWATDGVRIRYRWKLRPADAPHVYQP